MKFWQAVAFLDTDQLLDIARITDEAGFHGIMVSDHVFFPEKLTSPYPYAPDGKPYWSPSTPWPASPMASPRRSRGGDGRPRT